ncbi:hypothetical protein [Mesorhizobium muleiense]|uniref:hypothetical protein n=1 Tax=Mesorhizobium muleiense TaxID=1004279 RepID=UPI001F4555D4|nr:hypothetical protein [Mesorhizobium muleiense]MCF6112386.1 hypothetical protein [Mesorhizobium muleiense]
MTTIGEKWPSQAQPENPFKRGEDGKIKSLSAITAIARENPRRAIELCKAAGEDLNKWFPMNPR